MRACEKKGQVHEEDREGLERPLFPRGRWVSKIQVESHWVSTKGDSRFDLFSGNTHNASRSLHKHGKRT